jgi:hypothetical protein
MRTPKGLIITNQSFCHDEIVQSFENSGNKLTEAKTPREAILDAFSRRPPPLQLPVGRNLSGPHITESITWINIL